MTERENRGAGEKSEIETQFFKIKLKPSGNGQGFFCAIFMEISLYTPNTAKKCYKENLFSYL